MNRKISWGIVFIVFALFYLIEMKFPELIYQLKENFAGLITLNFRLIIIILGIFFLIKRKIILAFICLYIGGRMVFGYSEYFSPLFIMFMGIVYVFLGIEENSWRKNRNE